MPPLQYNRQNSGQMSFGAPTQIAQPTLRPLVNAISQRLGTGSSLIRQSPLNMGVTPIAPQGVVNPLARGSLVLNKHGGVKFPATQAATPAQASAPVAAASPVVPATKATAASSPAGFASAAQVPQQNPVFSIPTGDVDSSAVASRMTIADLMNKRTRYQEAVEGQFNAAIPSKDYLDALRRAQEAKQMQMQIEADLLTNAPGDTLGFAQGMAGRARALNALELNAANNALAVQEAIRTGNINAYQSLVQATAPTSLSYGQQLTDPFTGQIIATGQQQPSYSATASPFGGYMIFNQRTGQYEMVGAEQMLGGGGSLPTMLQPALGQTFSGQRYLDSSLITSAQMPYAQQVSASLGIPLLSKEDVNKIQDAQATYNSGVGLIDSIASLSDGLIYAQNPAQAVAQNAVLSAQAAVSGTQARLYQDARNGFLSLITRAAGEKGTLAQGDVERIQAALPSFGDTVQTAQTKIDTLSNIFSSALQGNIAAYLGSKVVPSTGAPSATGGGIDISQYAF